MPKIPFILTSMYTKMTPDIVKESCDNILNCFDNLYKNLVNLPNDQLTWETFVMPQIQTKDNLASDFGLFNMSTFLPDKNVREACSASGTKIANYNIDVSMRKDLYEKYKSYYENSYKKEEKRLSTEQKRYVENIMRDYRREGMTLPTEKYERVKEIKKTINELCEKYSQNLVDEKTSFLFSKEELAGMTNEFLEKRKVEDDKYKVTLKYPDYIPAMEYCENRKTREILYRSFNSRCRDVNMSLSITIFNLRTELAKLLGYAQYGDYVLENRMAKNTENVMNFLNNMKNKMKSLSEEDISLLQKLAPDGEKIEAHDIMFYSRIYKERETNLNDEELRKHFPLDTVMSGMFQIFQKLFGVRFNDVTNNYKDNMWHEEVELFEVVDAKSNETMGYFYLDLFPREGKYGHAAVFQIVPGSVNNLPVSTMVCNFQKGECIKFSDLVIFFHEFGHIMHNMCSATEMSCFSGTNCETDFVEAPSQMLEDFCYMPNCLKMMSVNLSDDTITKLINRKTLLKGYHYARQLSFGLFDMLLHSNSFSLDEESIRKLYSDISYETIGVRPLDDINFVTCFGHLMSGYDVGYYGYLWSEVYARDMFYSKFYTDQLDEKTGATYRKEILSYGGARDSIESLKIFLGREPNSYAFFKALMK